MKRYLSAKYVEQFRCDGKACGARCCRGWSIGLTEEDRKRLIAGFASAPVPLRLKRDAVVRNDSRSNNQLHPYSIRFNEEGVCPYLEDDLLCGVHSTLGEGALADLCAQYPREVGTIGGEYEIWATLACPEAARLCLLSDSGADLVELVDVASLRHVNNLIAVNSNTTDYEAYLDEVRRFVVELLSRKEFSLQTRLFAVAYFGQRTATYFTDRSKQVDRRRLLADMATVREPSFLAGLNRELDSNAVPGNYAMALISSVIEADLGTCLESPNDEQPKVTTDTAEITSEAWLQNWIEYCTKRQRWEKDFRDVVDRAFENYSKVFWLKDWYVYSPNLLVHAVACILRVAVMRFRLFNHGALQQVVEGATSERHKELLERTMLEVVGDVTRTIDHNRAFRRSLHEALARRKMEDSCTCRDPPHDLGRRGFSAAPDAMESAASTEREVVVPTWLSKRVPPRRRGRVRHG
ncbi:MAG: flagellin lysine-N-methylase [Polyangiaceae bacterium]